MPSSIFRHGLLLTIRPSEKLYPYLRNYKRSGTQIILPLHLTIVPLKVCQTSAHLLNMSCPFYLLYISCHLWKIITRIKGIMKIPFVVDTNPLTVIFFSSNVCPTCFSLFLVKENKEGKNLLAPKLTLNKNILEEHWRESWSKYSNRKSFVIRDWFLIQDLLERVLFFST